jgi:hypothetical protein
MHDELEIEFDNCNRILGLEVGELELIKNGSREYLEKLASAVPDYTSDLAENWEAPSWATAANEALWAAAYYGQPEYAKEIYERCKLDGRRWTFTDISFGCPLPCPVCFTMGHEDCEFTCGHDVYRLNFGDGDESEFFPHLVLQTLDEAPLDLELDQETWTRICEMPEVAQILDNLSKSNLWFVGFPCAQLFRSLSARCDHDQFGDIEYLGFHPTPKKFMKEVGKLEAQILKKLKAAGADVESL